MVRYYKAFVSKIEAFIEQRFFGSKTLIALDMVDSQSARNKLAREFLVKTFFIRIIDHDQ